MTQRSPGTAPKWPKNIPALSEEQKRVKEDFMEYWHEVLPRRYGIFERFNHRYPLRSHKSTLCNTLEIGSGLGEHIAYEDLTQQNYVAVDIRENMVQKTKERFPGCTALLSDCQDGVPFADDTFDRAIAVHVLEHIPNLPAALRNIARVLKPTGEFSVVIPCDPGTLYSFARKISTQRLFRKRYNDDFGWLIASEHINTPKEIFDEIDKVFQVSHRSYFPSVFPVKDFNLAIGITLRKKS